MPYADRYGRGQPRADGSGSPKKKNKAQRTSSSGTTRRSPRVAERGDPVVRPNRPNVNRNEHMARQPLGFNPTGPGGNQYNQFAKMGGGETGSIEDLMAQLGFGGDDGGGQSQFDIEAMIQQQFAPQYAAIDAARNQLQGRYNTGNAALGSMYGGLQQSIQGDAAGIAAQNDAAIQGITQAADSAQANTDAAYGKSQTEHEALLRRLGIEAAAPQTALNPDRAFMNQLMETSQQGATQAQQGMKAGALNYNTSAAQNAGLTGKAAQAALGRDFGEQMFGLDMRKLDMDTERVSSRSQLEQQLMESAAASRREQEDDQWEMFKYFDTAQRDRMSAKDKLAQILAQARGEERRRKEDDEWEMLQYYDTAARQKAEQDRNYEAKYG